MSGMIFAPGAAPWASGLVDLLVLLGGRGTLVVLAGLLLSALMARSTASARHLVWTATLCGLLLLPLVSALAPTIDLPVLPRLPSAEGGEVSATVAGRVSIPATAGPGLRAAPATEAPASSAAAAAKRVPWLAVIYLAGVAATLTYFGAGLLAVRRLTRAAEPPSQAAGWGSLPVSMPRAGAARPRILATPSLRAPVTWGTLDPVVLLPKEASSWPPSDLRRALVHELAHIERRDWATALLARLACCLYWFHPLVWLAARRQALESERACDDRVLAAGTDSSDYAGQLLSLVRSTRAGSGLYPTAVSMARRSHLEPRIRSILDPQRRRHPMRPLARPLVFVLACLPALLMGAVTLAPATAEEPSADHGQSPLVRAAAAGDLARVEELIAAGADVNRESSGEHESLGQLRTPLATAARAGHLEIARALLDAGAEVDLAPRGDATALIEAAGHGHTGIVELLLDRGADPDRLVRGDGTPLIAAARGGNREIVDLLLAAGADSSMTAPEDDSPLQSAAESGNAEVLASLAATGVDLDVVMPGDGTPLIIAARAGHLRAVRFLVESGADIERVVPGDETALIQAAGAGHLEVVKYLVERGADVDTSVLANGGEVRTALGQARRGGHDEVVEYLLAAGAGG